MGVISSGGTITSRVHIYEAELKRFLGKIEDEAAKKAAEVTRTRIKRFIVMEGRVRTGKMLNSVRVRKRPRGQGHGYVVSVDVPYYKYQNYGVRAHGPVSARFLVFTPKGSNRVVFAKWVRGFAGGHFSERAYKALTVKDFL